MTVLAGLRDGGGLAGVVADRLIGDEGARFRIALTTLDHTRVTITAQGDRDRAGGARLPPPFLT